MRNITTAFLFILAFALKAAPGDTTWVSVHNNTQLKTYKTYSSKGLFPDGTNTYQKILMYYTLGCATTGCSDWDYTTRVNLLSPTGEKDSIITSIDTISKNPLVLDTTYKVRFLTEAFEMARVITPYANGFANDWKHDYVFDVTDFYPMLKDSLEMQVQYQGWSSGFSATINFAFIEGPRPRDVYKIENVYMGKDNYMNSSDFEQYILPSKTIDVLSQTTGILLRANFSGHGFVNSLNCAEFCDKDYYVKVNGQTVATQAMWRDDCGLNPIWPQPGTWLYDRANWCPGDKSLFRMHDLSAFANNSTFDLDLDIEPYTYTVATNETPANYNYAVQLIQYGNASFSNDVALERIMAPSNEDEFGRINPICGTAVVKIKNSGSQALTSCVIRYGLKGQAWSAFSWSGNLASMESEIVELPFGTDQDWWAVAGINYQFEAIVSEPNGLTDENELNNNYISQYEAPETFPSNLKLLLKTNGSGSDTYWDLTALDGTQIDAGDNLSDNTTTTTVFNLDPGCYVLSIKDRSKNGLSFFANNDGTGSIQLRNDGGTFFAKTLNANFGTELTQHFTVGYTVGQSELPVPQTTFVDVYPNPAKEKLNLNVLKAGKHNLLVNIFDITGKSALEKSYEMENEVSETLDISMLTPGIYIIETSVDAEIHREKIVVQ